MVSHAYIHIPFCSHKCDFCDFAAFAGVAPDRLRLLHQVHGRQVVFAGREDGAWQRPAADAIAGDDPSVALVVRVADCAPMLIADRKRPVPWDRMVGGRALLVHPGGAATAAG